MGMNWGRALGGAGAAAAGIANKYIDEEIQNNRAQLLADIQHANMVRGDQYQLSDERQAQVRKNATEATMSQGAAQRASQVAGATDESYQSALDTEAARGATRKIDAEGRAITELAPKKIEAERMAIQQLTPTKIAAEKQALEELAKPKAQAAGLITRATDLEGGNRALRAQLLGMEVADRRRLGSLYDDYMAIVNDTKMTEPEKASKLGPIANAIQAVKAKSGQAGPAAARNPELDTETVKEERMNPDGTTTTTTRVQKRLPGNMPEQLREPDLMARTKAAMDAARAERQGK